MDEIFLIVKDNLHGKVHTFKTDEVEASKYCALLNSKQNEHEYI